MNRKADRLTIDPAKFYNDFFRETTVEKRLEELRLAGMEEITSSRGWYGYELPSCRWSDNWKDIETVSNYRSWPRVAPGWILQVSDGGQFVCMLRRKAVAAMPEKEWNKLIEKVNYIKTSYPIVSEDEYSDVEQEFQDEEWNKTYRKEFQEAILAKFSGVFLGSHNGEEREAKFQKTFEDDELTDEFFYSVLTPKYSKGDEWSYSDGGVSLDLTDIMDDVKLSDITEFLWPEDPRQLKFKFMHQVESIVKKMLEDDLMVMIESPTAKIIVYKLLEDEGPHRYSCLMVYLPEDLANHVIAWGKLQIRNEDIYVDENGGMGREEEQHVTVLYGLVDEKPSDMLLQVFEHTAPFDVKLGAVKIFRNDGYDVVVLEVISPFLHALNRNVRSVAAYENDYDNYTPHCTVAYVKPGTCDRLEGASPWDDPVKLGVTTLGQDGQFTARTVLFSSMNGQKTEYTLGSQVKGEKAINEGLSTWETKAFESFMGRPPESEGELQKWIREAYQLFYRETGNIKGLRGWLLKLQEAGKVDYRNPALAE